MRMRDQRPFPVALLLGFFALGIPSARATDDAAAETAIRSATDHWVASFNGGDVNGVLSHYAEDSVVMVPGTPAVRGFVAIREVVARDVASAQASRVRFVKGSVDDVAVWGDVASHWGTFAVRDESNATVDTGKYCETWRRVNGQWRIVRDIWNSDTPAPATAVAPAPTGK